MCLHGAQGPGMSVGRKNKTPSEKPRCQKTVPPKRQLGKAPMPSVTSVTCHCKCLTLINKTLFHYFHAMWFFPLPFSLEHLTFCICVNYSGHFKLQCPIKKKKTIRTFLTFCSFVIQKSMGKSLDPPKIRDLLMPSDKEAKKFKADGAGSPNHGYQSRIVGIGNF